MDRMIQMIINAVLRQVINRGVRSGIDKLTGGKKPGSSMTGLEGQQAQDAKAIARKAANLARRMKR